MPKIQKLGERERASLAHDLPHWRKSAARDAIERDFKFKTFGEAWAFMSAVAHIAEQMDHHPEWSNVYNRVSILLTTHDCDGLSERDIAMARAIDDWLARSR